MAHLVAFFAQARHRACGIGARFILAEFLDAFEPARTDAKGDDAAEKPRDQILRRVAQPPPTSSTAC
ncbi:hypothetical protein AS156_13855 [Bradyrhizobium macuxiense]|uniref:Uncharacterized protein n=1 Tax=Bradyrhizobium macuxiense TaxID=1755647 RepID=A0A109JL48_9BRAD|nr:hypothetical protein [Bradyrhizobium macuxiense]KWV50913.1 hypothetical protein AS156_13855 [Bradyrhizobium macuxiense]